MELAFTRFLHSRYGFLLMLLMSAGAAVLAYLAGGVVPIDGDSGFAIPSANVWLAPYPDISLAVSLLLNAACAIVLIYINKRFNIIRSLSLLFAGIFLIMQGGAPLLMGQLYNGILMCMLMLMAIIALFTTFHRPERTRRIFISFFLLSAGSMACIPCWGGIAALAIGCLQMRCANLRTALAALAGIATPYWIGWGFGIYSLASLRWPEFVSVFSIAHTRDFIQTIAYAAISLFLGIGFGTLNLFKIYAYNARTRAYNGFLLVLSILTAILIVVDYHHLIDYLPVLNVCTALQIGHFFTINHHVRAYIPIICIIAMYALLYLWYMLV